VRGRGIRTSAFVAVAALALLITAEGPAAAFTVTGQSGLTGPYSLTDAMSPAGYQAVVCSYSTAGSKLTLVTAHHPVVKARNRTAGRDSQVVAWQFIVQHATPSGTTFTTLYASPFARAKAYDNLAAPFADRSWQAPPDPTGKYRVVIVVRWYVPGSTTAIAGQVKLRDGFYESRWNGHSIVSPDWCLQDY